MQALTFTPSHDNSWLVYVRGHVTTSTRCPPCLVRSLHAPMRFHHSIGDRGDAGGEVYVYNSRVVKIFKRGFLQGIPPSSHSLPYF
jgi:hypothetical protein